MKTYLILTTILLLSASVFGQPKAHIEHYNLADGLPQRSIMHIIQDKKGFIWLATWDGLCKFDGYNFTSYKTSVNDPVIIGNNRIHTIVEDTYGYLWVISYSDEVFKFDPHKEKYVDSFQKNGELFRATDILPVASGNVWLISKTMGGICVSDSLGITQQFSAGETTLPHNYIHTVFEDSNRTSWILTAGGLQQVSPALNRKEEYQVWFNEPDHVKKFFTALETDNEIWFGADNGQIWCYDKENNGFSLFDMRVNSDIVSIRKVYDNLFIILTSEDGFFICDRNKTNLKKIDKTNQPQLPTDKMVSCFIDSNHNIWLQTDLKGVAKFNLINNELKYYTPNDYGNNTILFPSFFIVEDKKGHIWVHPRGGFSFYNEKEDNLQPFFNNPLSPEWRFSDMLHHIFLDKQGILWLSTRSGGLEKIVFDNTLFKLNDFYSNKISITGSEVRAILEDSNHNIWLGNMGGVISVYDSKRNLKGYLCENGTISKSGTPLNAMAYTLTQDSEGNIWIGTKGAGVYLLKPKDQTYTSFRVEQFRHNPDDPFCLSDDAIYSIHEDKEGRIWLGSYGGGINLFDRHNKQFLNGNNRLKNYPAILGDQVRVVRSHKNKIYVGTTLGLIVFSADPGADTVSDYKIYSKTGRMEDGIQANDIHNILITANGDLYIATFGGGMSKVTEWDTDGYPASFKTYDIRNGLHSDIVLSITEDTKNCLWINSEGTLSQFNPQDESFEQFNDVSHTISNQYFMETLPLLTSDGELIYGCAHGTLSFYPDKIIQNTYSPYLALTRFKVSNTNYPLQTQIDDINEIILNHKEDVFSIEFMALDYTNPRGISYAYKLDGFDKDWIMNKDQRIANYTNIPPGNYQFRVRSTNSNGTWVDNERILPITITPSFWQTKWAYLIYIISFVLILYTVLRSIILFYRMRDKVKLEYEQTEMKTRFFTDISHEIRTPLTMIVSPIQNILENPRTHPEIKPHLQLVLRNANRMLTMVNQILDFRKIQKKKLQVKEVAIGELIENLCETSFKIVESADVKINIQNHIDKEKIWVDPDSIEKLVSNLLSNAVKYSDKGTPIDVLIYKKDKAIVVQVSDQGEGMNKEVQSKLFTRFASYSKDKSKPNTGIGLSIVKEIVDKHYAKITVESEPGKGTCFTIYFQQGLEHFSKDRTIDIIHAEEEEQSDLSGSLYNPEQTDENQQPGQVEKKLSVLVVEDDPDLRSFIRSVLTDHYEVCEAQDGKEGYEKALKQMPDFILSDIMMPVMDGIEFLRKIRANQNTSHIPFILLTAKTNMDDQLGGITSGANDYITKPFSVKLLIAKIDNIIRQRKIFAGYIGGIPPVSTGETEELVKQNKLTEQDQQFLRNLQEDIYNNIDNGDFTIDDLVSNTSFSRRVFFNKVKSLTGQAPVEFVREIRIKHAARLLQTQQYRIKEVAYMVGFSDIRYFTQCFKALYNMTPSQYKEQFTNE